MIVRLQEIEAQFSGMLDRGELDRFLLQMRIIAFQLSRRLDLTGRAVFLPAFDALMLRAHEMLRCPAAAAISSPTLVHVASEVYDSGGHTRVIVDIARALPEYRHVLILTDALENYQTGRRKLGPLEERFKAIGLEAIILTPHASPAVMAWELCEHIARLAPQAVLLMAHHFDTIAYAALSGRSAPRVLFMHHADHNPTLGATRRDYTHVDLTPACHEYCKAKGGTSPIYLGMTVEDRGMAERLPRDKLIGVTCGSSGKFAGKAEFSYADILAALLAGGVEKFFHIGTLREAQMTEIKADIHAQGQDDARIVFLPNKPSLGESLLEIRPDFFLNSFPIGGAKAIIEALSAGIPTLTMKPDSIAPLVMADMALGKGLVLQKLEQIPSGLHQLRTQCGTMSRASREVFEQHYSHAAFRGALISLI